MHVVQPSALVQQYYNYGSGLNQSVPAQDMAAWPGAAFANQVVENDLIGAGDNVLRSVKADSSDVGFDSGFGALAGTIEPTLAGMSSLATLSPSELGLDDPASDDLSATAEVDSGRASVADAKRGKKGGSNSKVAAARSLGSWSDSPATSPLASVADHFQLSATGHVNNKGDEIYDRRTIKRLKNREAAARCRHRRKQLIEDLEKQIMHLTDERDTLRQQMQQLIARVHQLEYALGVSTGSVSNTADHAQQAAMVQQLTDAALLSTAALMQ